MKPDWNLYNKLFDIQWLNTSLKTILSNTLPSADSNDIGLKLDSNDIGLKLDSNDTGLKLDSNGIGLKLDSNDLTIDQYHNFVPDESYYRNLMCALNYLFVSIWSLIKFGEPYLNISVTDELTSK